MSTNDRIREDITNHHAILATDQFEKWLTARARSEGGMYETFRLAYFAAIAAIRQDNEHAEPPRWWERRSKKQGRSALVVAGERYGRDTICPLCAKTIRIPARSEYTRCNDCRQLIRVEGIRP